MMISARKNRPAGFEYLFAVFIVALSTSLSFVLFRFFSLINLSMIYLLGTLLVSSRGSLASAGVAAILSVLCFDFFFVPPRFTFTVSDVQYIFTFVVMFLTAMLISHLTIRLRLEAEEARHGQMRTAMVYELAQELSNTHGQENILKAALHQLTNIFSSRLLALIPNLQGRLDTKVRVGGAYEISEKDRAVAQWVYDAGQAAGVGTDSLPQADALFIPILGAEKTVGVLCLAPRDHAQPLNPVQRKLLDSLAHQIGMALEVDRLEENAKQKQMEVEAERLRNALLSSVSHDLRTPLTAIVGSAGALLEKKDQLKKEEQKELLENIQSQGEHLSRLVQNLLDSTRLESGTVKVKKELYPLEEVIGSALEHISGAADFGNLHIKIPEGLPLIPMDCLLIEQVFVNLLENAVRATPLDKSIEVTAQSNEKQVLISVVDHGTGLSEAERERVFEKFYRGSASNGSGLGLAICRGIVNAHGGKIWAETNSYGGATFQFTLPLNLTNAN